MKLFKKVNKNGRFRHSGCQKRNMDCAIYRKVRKPENLASYTHLKVEIERKEYHFRS